METPPTESFGRTLWLAWVAYAERGSGYQGKILLSLVYYLVMSISAIGARLAGKKLLDLDTRPQSTYWLTRKPADKSLAALQRQY